MQPDIKEIGCTSKFLFEKEKDLFHILCTAFYEMAFSIHSFETKKRELLKNPPQDVLKSIAQLNETRIDFPKNIIIEFHVIDLSTYFKTFLILSKSVLDKLVPLFSYRFDEKLRQFSDKGVRLVNVINNSGKISKKVEMVALLREAKTDWLDSLIWLRDQYAHYSSLPQYRNFWVPGEKMETRQLKNLADFSLPSIEVASKEIEALAYMLMIKEKLVALLREFLRLCDFTPSRRPKIRLHCDCGHLFAKATGTYPNGGTLTIFDELLQAEIKDRKIGYGVLVCPECGDKTDTDLDFWPSEALT